MKVIEMHKLLRFLKNKTNENYSWNDFCNKFYIFKNIDRRLTSFDNGDSYDLERFSDIIENKFNTALCSPPFKYVDWLNGTYFYLKELLAWNFLMQFKHGLEELQEEKLLSKNILINEDQIKKLINCLDYIDDDKLKNEIKQVSKEFEIIMNS